MTNCFTAFDGNGNVSALVDASNGTVAANYEYGPFGEVIRATGPMAKVDPIRFSTKYQDDESDLLYYGYRYYKASTGTWASRDPVGEKGGANLYRFVGNNPVSKTDLLGLSTSGTSSGSLDLLLTYLGFENGQRLSQDMMLDVINSSTVTSFGDLMLAQARGQWTCAKSGSFMRTQYSDNYSPESDLGFFSASGFNWFFTGNWQLFLKASCTWKCNQCSSAPACNCKCSTVCKISGNLSKTYTLSYVGGNIWNILTTPTDVLPTETFNVSEDFTTPRLDIGTSSKGCGK
jgi:RHS repeat-associated protein